MGRRTITAGALTLLLTAFATMASPATAGNGVHGDANCSGRVDAIDSSLVLQYGAGITGTLSCHEQADVDWNGSVNSVDASLILQRVAGLLPSFGAYVSLNRETPATVGVGEEVVVEIHIEDVERLAGFDFELAFDRSALELVRYEDIGAFLDSGNRGHPICFPGPGDELDVMPRLATCSTVGVPVCMGGGTGASGGGTLARAVFRATGAGSATVSLSRSTLVWDDVSSCDPSRLDPVRIPHGRGGGVAVTVQ